MSFDNFGDPLAFDLMPSSENSSYLSPFQYFGFVTEYLVYSQLANVSTHFTKMANSMLTSMT